MKLEQIFYGNAGSGYRILASSDPALAETAAEICRAVGTPDGISALAPFLVSVPEGDKLYMARCCPGRADGVGRKTLFFHVFVGNRAEASRAGVSAFSLSDAGRFSESLPLGGCAAVQIDRLDDAAARNKPSWDGVPVRLARSRPADAEVRNALGSRVNEVAWASFSFCNLEKPFVFYAVSEHTALPTTKKDASSSTGREAASPTKATKNALPSVIWKCVFALSLLLNAWFFFSSPRENGELAVMDSREIRKQELDEARDEGRREGREQKLRELRDSFPADKVMLAPDVASLTEGKQKAYIQFVNEKILTTEQERKED